MRHSETTKRRRRTIALAVAVYGLYLVTWSLIAVLYAEPSSVQTTARSEHLPPPPATPGLALDLPDEATHSSQSSPTLQAAGKLPAAIQGKDELVAIEPPPFSPEVFPCSDCHEENDPEVDTSRTDDLFHDDIVLQHDPENLWCYSCHTPLNRDILHLSNGQSVPFTESFRLCGQCHGTQLRDWRAGDHGKRTGFWLGKKTYLLCAHCHSPHSPSFQPIEPLPPPIRQEFIK